MPRIRHLLICLTAIEVRDFLPGNRLAEITVLADQLTQVDPLSLDQASWEALLAKTNPEVILGCWRLPPLPEKLPSNLRYVCYLAGSIKKFATREQIVQGLQITNWGDSISRTIAECALLHTLTGLRGMAHWTIAMHTQGAWKDDTTITASLFGRKIGIRGFGRIAKELLKLLRPFGCEISIHAPDVDAAVAEQFGIRISPTLEDLFSYNDVVVELAPLIPITRGSIKEAHLRLLRPRGVFVNVGRGATVDEDALLRVAQDGKIAVGLDVYSEEPLPKDSPFRGLPNVSLTPHLAGPTTDRRRDAGTHGYTNLLAYVEDRPLIGAITPEIYDRST